VSAEYSGVRLHAATGYVTSPTSTKAETMLFASNAAMASPLHSWHESITVGTLPPRGRTSDREPSVAGYCSVPAWLKESDTSVRWPASPVLYSVVTANPVITIPARGWAEVPQ
jgi:hypothetical protein